MTQENSHTSRSHALLGGSSASRWVNCPGSVFFLKNMPPEPSSPAAREGTKAHEIAEIVLEDFLSHKINGTDPDIRAHLTGTNELMLEAAQGYKDAVWEKILGGSITGKVYGMEESFVLDTSLDMSGIVDFWAIYIDDRGKRVACVVDFKYGYYPVPVDKNMQLGFYACALREELIRAGKDIDYVRAAIYQPRAKNQEAYSETRFTAKQLSTLKKAFFKAAKQIFVEEKPKFKVGPWCKFCGAQGVCDTYQKELSSKSSLMLVNAKEQVLPEPTKMSDDALAKIVNNYDALEAFIGSVKKHVISRCLNGKPVNGFKVIAGPTRRKWKEDEDQIVQSFSTKYGICPTTQKLLGITAVEKELSKMSSKDEAKRILEEFTTKTNPSMVLVPADDPRPAFEGAVGLLPDLDT